MTRRRLLPLLLAALAAVSPIAVVAKEHMRFVETSLRLTWEKSAPNGEERWMVKVNGTFPGPDLVFDEGDLVQIRVYNDMPQNSSVHWHGLDMSNMPWSDGVPGLSQRPIAPGEDFIYRFKAQPAGQYWYHAHYRTQMMDGLYGSLYIRRKEGSPEPWDLISSDPEDIKAMHKASRDPKMIMISDWTHVTSDEYMQITKDSNVGTFCSDSILINGKGGVYCPGQKWMTAHQTWFNNMSWEYPATLSDKGCFPYTEKTVGFDWTDTMNLTALPPGFVSGCKPSSGPREIIEVDAADRWVSLNFINAATLKAPEVAVDQHEMWIYEVDGQLITPLKTDIFSPYAGERYSAMVRLDQEPQDYPIRVPDSSFTQVIAEYAILRYKTERLPQETQSEGFYNLTYHGRETIPYLAYNGDVLNNGTVLDESLIHPYPSWDPLLRPARHSDQHFVWDMTRVNTSWKTGINYPHLYPADHDATLPLLFHPDDAGAYDDRYVVRTRNGTWVDIVLQVSAHPFWPRDFPHAMHKHGNKFWLIGKGEGIWNYSSVDEAIALRPQDFNLENPPYRDTFRNGFSGAEWLVLRYQVVQPGAWLFHCHVETHLAAGMAMAILDGVDAWPEIPPPYAVDQRGHWPEKAVNKGALSAWPKDEEAPGFWSWLYHAINRYWLLITVAFTLGAAAGALLWRRRSKSRKGYTPVPMYDPILVKLAAEAREV